MTVFLDLDEFSAVWGFSENSSKSGHPLPRFVNSLHVIHRDIYRQTQTLPFQVDRQRARGLAGELCASSTRTGQQRLQPAEWDVRILAY